MASGSMKAVSAHFSVVIFWAHLLACVSTAALLCCAHHIVNQICEHHLNREMCDHCVKCNMYASTYKINISRVCIPSCHTAWFTVVGREIDTSDHCFVAAAAVFGALL